eukprot:8579919-Pyramimonas_sp.AAC.1
MDMGKDNRKRAEEGVEVHLRGRPAPTQNDVREWNRELDNGSRGKLCKKQAVAASSQGDEAETQQVLPPAKHRK